ncbi:MAG: serine/threonine-protein kinase [Pedobacter sp.]
MSFGRYEILKEIGKGSMGVVYQARDPNLDLVVALKALRQDRLANEPFVRRFLTEAKVLGRLDHPNIVRVFNVDQDGDTVYIAMEFIEGESFTTLMKERRFSTNEIAEFGATVAEALDYAHQRGVVHRDVKPSNILFRSDGRLKITDFGIAHIEDPSAPEQTQAGEILGTPAYMSPEQVLSRNVDGRSDLFSLGIILYELATGSRPFGGQGINAIFNAITKEEPPAVLTKSSEVPKDLSDVIMKCLRKAPEERYANGRELAAALRTAVEKSDSPVSMMPQQKQRSRRALLYTIIVFLCVAGITTYFLASKVSAPLVAVPPVVETAKPAVLSVESSPEGAQVYVDGTLKGMAPARLELSTGKHEVRLSLPHYYEWEAQVELKEEAATPLQVKLIPMNDK